MYRRLNTSLTVDKETSNVKMYLTDGSKCNAKGNPESKALAATAIEFVCDRTIFGPGKPRLVAQLPPHNDDIACAFFVEWRTHVRILLEM
jgi:cation-dependent mannose-6-phosphate receptor